MSVGENERGEARGDERPGAGTTVFIAEDEAIIRLDLRETLETLGFDIVGESGRGDEAEIKIRELVPDVAILDIKMPGLSGLEVARSLSSDLVCAVVVLSAFSLSSLVEEAAEAGVMAYLLKPFQGSELAASIAVARARHRQMAELVAEKELLGQRLADRVVVGRAKGVLVDQQGMSEVDAMRFLQKVAMDGRRPVRDVAADVLSGALAP